MFLDDELTQIYNEQKADMTKCVQSLFDAMVKRMPKPENITPGSNPLNEFKRIDASWRLFCKKVGDPVLKPDGFRSVVKSADTEGNVVKALGW